MLQRLDRYSWSSWKKTSLNEWGSFLWKGRRCHTSTSLDSHLGKRIFYRKEIAGNKAATSFGWAAAAGRRSEMSILTQSGSCHHHHKNWNCSLRIIQDWIRGGFPRDQTLAGAKLLCVTATVLWWRELFVLQLPTFILPIKSYQTSNYQEDSWASVWRLDILLRRESTDRVWNETLTIYPLSSTQCQWC